MYIYESFKDKTFNNFFNKLNLVMECIMEKCIKFVKNYGILV